MFAKRKQWVMMLLTAVSVLLVAAGCSGSGGEKEEPKSTNAGGEPVAAATDKPKERGKASVVIQDRGGVAATEGTYEDNRWTKWILENGPVDMTFVPVLRSESKKLLNVMFASGSAPDIVNETNAPFRNNLYEQKQLLPLDDLLQYMPNYQKLIDEYPQLKQVGTKSDGKLYEIGRINEANQEHSWNVEDGKIIRQWDKELAALTFKKQLYDQKIIDSDYISDKDGSKAKQDFLNGKLGIYANFSMSWFDFTTKDLVTLKNNVPDAVVAPMAFPESPFGQYTGAVDNPIQMTTVFNVNTKDPVAAAEYVNFILEPETTKMLMKGEEGTHWVAGANGCATYPDSEKWTTEAGYAGGYGLFLSRGTDKCNFVVNLFDPADELQKAGLDMYLAAKEMYLDPSKQYPGFTLGDHIPGLPSDLDVIRANVLKEINDLYVKAIVSGAKYSADQAVADAQAAWEKAGGAKIIDFMNEWYAANKDIAFMADDLWTIVEQQKALAAK
ncbi:hypothetical protein AB4Z21_30380 [Paenibacillus sp. MCAF20]